MSRLYPERPLQPREPKRDRRMDEDEAYDRWRQEQIDDALIEKRDPQQEEV